MRWFCLLASLLFTAWLFDCSARPPRRQPVETVWSPIIVKTSDTVLDGRGRHLKLGANSDCPMIVVGDPDHTEPQFRVRRVTIKNWVLDGNRLVQGGEIWRDHPVTHSNFIRNNIIDVRGADEVVIENCIITGARSGGICVEKRCQNVTIANCLITDSQFDAVSAYDSTGLTVRCCQLDNNLAAGISFDCNLKGAAISDTTMRGNSVGAFIRHSQDVWVGRCKLENRDYDAFVVRVEEMEKPVPNTTPLNIQFYKTDVQRAVIRQWPCQAYGER